MESRKIIKFGKNSFVVSLPREWLDANKLKKGDELFIEQRPESLLLSAARVVTEEKHAYINCDKKSGEELRVEILAYYTASYSTFIIEGRELSHHLSMIRQLLSNLSGVEIVEQERNRLVAKDMLDIQQIFMPVMISRMDMMLRSMFDDILSSESVPSDDLRQRDEDINRLQRLLMRKMRGVFENPALGAKLQVTPLKAYYYGQIGWAMERIGDYLKRLDGDMLRAPAKDREKIKKHVGFAYQKYLAAMKSYNAKSAELAVAVHNEAVTEIVHINKHLHETKSKDVMLAYENIKNIFRDLRIILRSTIEFPDVKFEEGTRTQR